MTTGFLGSAEHLPHIITHSVYSGMRKVTSLSSGCFIVSLRQPLLLLLPLLLMFLLVLLMVMMFFTLMLTWN